MMSLCTSVYMCFVVTCWERADPLALVCGVCCEFVTFPLVSWVVWYLIISIPDLCTLTYFKFECKFVLRRFRQNHSSDVHNGHDLEVQNGSMQCARIHDRAKRPPAFLKS